MNGLEVNTPAPVVGVQTAQQLTVTSIATQQALASSQSVTDEKSARFKEKAENQASKVMAELEKLQKLSNKKYYSYTPEQVTELFNAIQTTLEETKISFTSSNAEKKKLFTFTA